MTDPKWLDEAAEALVIAYGQATLFTVPWDALDEYQKELARQQARAVIAIHAKHLAKAHAG